jgi:FeS assembly SUF system protein
MRSFFNKLTGRGSDSETTASTAESSQDTASTAESSQDTATAVEGDAPSPAASIAGGTSLNVDALLAPRAAPEEAAAIGPTDLERTAALQPAIVAAISTVFDPEIPVNIYELGLIYDIAADAEGRVLVRMTLTSPACPSAQQIPSEVRYKVKAVEGVAECQVVVVWEPPWTKDMMSETAKLSLGMF